MVQALRRIFMVFTIVIVCEVNHIQSISVTEAEWALYMRNHSKEYINTAAELSARYNYAYNSKLIRIHNAYAATGRYGYTLAVNQFSDMRISSFNALFPKKMPLRTTNASPLPELDTNRVIPDKFRPSDIVIDYVPTVRDQGVKCISGWAYATATSVEMRDTFNNGTNAPKYSAQQLIDCAPAGSDGCVGHVPETAFYYLTEYDILFNSEANYPDDNLSPTAQSCRLVLGDGNRLGNYSHIPDGDERLLRAIVSDFYPVVIEFNPTSFEFMHYKAGVFKQPATKKGSHFMVVLGYDKDSWLVQNSFGDKYWGEDGFIRLKRNDVKARMPKSAIFPTS